MRQLKIFFLFFIISAYLFPRMSLAQSINNTSSLAEAQVLEIKDTGKVNDQNHTKITQVKLKILSGDLKGKIFTTEDNNFALPYQIHYKQGGKVIVNISPDGKGNIGVYISDYDRKPILLILFGLFLAVMLLVARKQGVTSLVGMLVSLYVIVQIILPQILIGNNAFMMTILGALIIIPITYYLAHGLNKKTTIAIAGTCVTLFLVAILSYVFSHLAHLSGSTEETVFLQNIYGSSINILSLLNAGMLIGSLAVLNDITISQASIVASLRKSNNKLKIKELYSHAMDVGKDHVASLVNTLILVYIGSSFPLVLLFYNTKTPLPLVFNQEIIATELIRTFVSSIGIVVAVPITTYLACIFTDKP